MAYSQTQLFCLSTKVGAYAPLSLVSPSMSRTISTATVAADLDPLAVSPSPGRPYNWLNETTKIMARQERALNQSAEDFLASIPTIDQDSTTTATTTATTTPTSTTTATTSSTTTTGSNSRPTLTVSSATFRNTTAQLPSADAYYWPYRWLGRRNKLLALFHDESYQSFARWFEAHPALASLAIPVNNLPPVKSWLQELATSNSTVSSPLRIIRENCTSAANALEHGEVVLSVYGTLNAGKSTLCNMLLGCNKLYGMCTLNASSTPPS
jgi:hypothetical protein